MEQKYFRESQLDNLKMIKVVEDVFDKPLGESNIFLNVKNVVTGNKIPLFPIMDSNGEIEMYELRLNQDYSLNETIEIPNIDVWADIKGGLIKFQSAVIIKKHFNKILAKEIESITSSHELDTLNTMLSKRKCDINYCLISNTQQLEELLKLKNTLGESLVKQDEKGQFIYDEQLPVYVAPTISKLSMCNLDEIVCKCIGDTKEIKQSLELIRHGKRAWNVQRDFGLAFMDETNVFSCNNIN